jgi:outer membrane immunogenic protein
MKRILGIAFGLALSTTAYAADMPAASQPPAMHPWHHAAMDATPFNWAGMYLGGQIGGGWGNHDRNNATGFANSYSSSGVVGGVFAGYNWLFDPHWMLGVEADISLASISGDDAGVGGTTDKTDIPWTGTINGRAGFINGRALFFVSGGFAAAGADQSNDAAGLSSSRTLTGWNIGGGLDYAFTDKLFGRVVYRYSDFGSESYPSLGVTPFSVTTQTHEVLFGLAMKLP